MSQGELSAGLSAKDATAGSSMRPPALLAPRNVHGSQATARPWFGADLIDAADRRHVTDPAIRQSRDWI